MKPIKFKESNITLAKDQPEYQQLPIHRDGKDNEGKVTSCWKLSRWERIKLLFTGKLWLSMMTFHRPSMPIFPTVHKHIVLGGMTEKEYKKTMKQIDNLLKGGRHLSDEENKLLSSLGDKVIEYERVHYPINADTGQMGSVAKGTGQ